MKNYCLLILALLYSVMLDAQVNMDFEALAPGGYTAMPGWTVGAANTYTDPGNNGLCLDYPASITGTAYVINTPTPSGFITPTLIPASPFGPKIVKLQSSSSGFQRLRQTINVTNNNSFFQFAFFFQFAGSHFGCCEPNYIKAIVRDCSNNLVPCGTFTLVGPNNNTCANNYTTGLMTGTNNIYYSPNWIIRNIDLSPYVGTCVTITFEVGSCIYSGHTAFCYFDSQIGPGNITGNGVQTGSTFVVCSGNTATLTAPAANTYTWSGPNGFTSSNQSIFTSTAGVYTLTLDNYGCPGITKTISVVFGSTLNATASSNTLCIGSSATLSANGNGVTSYSWSNGASTATTIVTPSVSTVYSVVTGPCQNTASVAVNVFTCTPLYQYLSEESSFRVFPNPADGTVTIESSDGEELQIFDASGRLIASLQAHPEKNRVLEMKDLPGGIYLITNRRKSVRLVVRDR